MAPPRKNTPYKQIFKQEPQGDDLRKRLKNQRTLGDTQPAEQEVNKGMKTRMGGASGRMKPKTARKEVASAGDNDDEEDDSDTPLPPSHRSQKASRNKRFELRVDSDDDGADTEEDVEEEEEQKPKQGKKGKGKAKEDKMLHLQVLALIPVGKQAVKEAKGGRLVLTKKDVDKFKAAGLWIDTETLAVAESTTQTELLIWARSFFSDKIDDMRRLKGVAEHSNVVSPLMIKKNTVELVPPRVKWDGEFVLHKARHPGKSAEVPAGRLSLVTSIAIPDSMMSKWTAEREAQLRREASEDRYSSHNDDADHSPKRVLSDDDVDEPRPVKRTRGGSPGRHPGNPVEVDDISDEDLIAATPTRTVTSNLRPRAPYLRPRPVPIAPLPVSPLPRRNAAAGPSSYRTWPAGLHLPDGSRGARVNHYQGMEDTANVPNPFASSDA